MDENMWVGLFWQVVAQLGTAAVIAAAIVYIGKQFFDHLLRRNLEREKAVLRRAGPPCVTEVAARIGSRPRGRRYREVG